MILASLLVMAGVAHSTPITFDEAVDGDLTSGVLAPPLEFGVGANTVAGTFSANNPSASDLGPSADFDNVLFRISGGLSLSRVQLAIPVSNGVTQAAFTLSRIYQDLPGVPRVFIGDSGDIDVPTNGFFDLSLGFDGWLTPGDYILELDYIQHLAGAGVRSADYTLKFDVASVPEPGALGMLGAGLLAFRVMQRRRTKSPYKSIR